MNYAERMRVFAVASHPHVKKMMMIQTTNMWQQPTSKTNPAVVPLLSDG
jgi:hypothetical protein